MPEVSSGPSSLPPADFLRRGMLCLGMAGAAFAGLVCMPLSEYLAAQRRPAAAGMVTAEHVVELTSSAGRRTYDVAVEYTFEAGGRAWKGNVLRPRTPEWSDRKDAEAVGARYPAGTAVTVHYDPKNPADCCIDPATPRALEIALAVGVGVALLGFGVAATRLFWNPPPQASAPPGDL